MFPALLLTTFFDAAPPLRPVVADLVRRLGADDFDAREAAQTRLAAFGPAVIPVLDRLEPIADPEAADRVRQVRRAVGGVAQVLREVLEADAPRFAELGERRADLDPAVLKLIVAHQPAAGDFLLSLVADPKHPLNRSATNAFVQAWAGMSAGQIRTYCERSLVLAVTHRPRYPAGMPATATAGYHFRHGWAGRPESEAVRIVTETTHVLDGRPYGKPYRYPHASCGCTTGHFRTGELAVGRHVASFAVRFEVGHGGKTVTGTVRSADFAFEVTPADTPDDLVAPADPATEKLVREAIQFAETDEAFQPANAGRFRLGGGEEQDWWRPQITWAEGGKPNGVHAPVWRLTKPLPVDLCFETTLRVEGTKHEYRCDPLILHQGQTFSSYFAVREVQELAKGRTGYVPVRVVLKGSRALALTDPRVTRYFSGEITSPVLRLKVGPAAP